MDETHIHGLIPTKLYTMQQIKYLSIELLPPMSLRDIYNPAPPSSYLHDYYIWFINKN